MLRVFAHLRTIRILCFSLVIFLLMPLAELGAWDIEEGERALGLEEIDELDQLNELEEDDDGEELVLEDLKDLQLFGNIQLWNVFTHGAKNEMGVDVDDRWDLYIRRGRLGFMGDIRDRVDYKFVFAYDNVGKNEYSAATGTPKEKDDNEFTVWDAYATARADPEFFNFTLGYFRPQVGRENITSAFRVNSFAKALNNSFVRLHLVGTGQGRETGINIGGLYHEDDRGFHYNIGIFDSDHEPIDGETGGKDWSPMFAGRFAYTFGDPELNDFGLDYRVNYMGERNGTTIAVNYTHQGETDAFDRNHVMGFDLLSNYGDFNLSAEYDWLKRDTGLTTYTDEVYFIRVGYNLYLENGQIIEPTAMYTKFNGNRRSADHPSLNQETHQIGLNWYLDYVLFNIFLAIQDDNQEDRGDYLGLGIQFGF